ncbi:hypothetical protein GTQ48_09710 [Alteromonas genovensis]|uniref:Uncharacterized protein n=1 Tax=Alteromonas genovensis TaxID=471225 RepID=A0A6N9TH34_9ALTE|nr:hypothetical protein [Alteromonas genovensis]NDW15792.1 hypothetical protein [Alteromonas genovensis]
MITPNLNTSLAELKSLIHQENLKEESVEVLLSNLLALNDEQTEAFSIPFHDVIVTIQTAIKLLKS